MTNNNIIGIVYAEEIEKTPILREMAMFHLILKEKMLDLSFSLDFDARISNPGIKNIKELPPTYYPFEAQEGDVEKGIINREIEDDGSTTITMLLNSEDTEMYLNEFLHEQGCFTLKQYLAQHGY